MPKTIIGWIRHGRNEETGGAIYKFKILSPKNVGIDSADLLKDLIALLRENEPDISTVVTWKVLSMVGNEPRSLSNTASYLLVPKRTTWSLAFNDIGFR